MTNQMDLFAEPSEPVNEPEPEKVSQPRILYFDLETQKSADDVGGWANSHLMKISVGVVWDSLEQKHCVYEEKDAPALVEKLRSASLVVGFNVIGFDYSVLQPYADIDLHEINTFDMLVDVQKKLGHRLSLNHLAHETLNSEKSADGLQALVWYKEGKIDLITEYCKKDVEITRDLFLHGEKNGFVMYKTRDGRQQKLEIDWSLSRFVEGQ